MWFRQIIIRLSLKFQHIDDKIMKIIDAQVAWLGREEASLRLELNDMDEIVNAKLSGIGGPEFLRLLKETRLKLEGDLQKLSLPEGVSPAALCLRELILKAKGEWSYPYESEELCHCRAVPTIVVDQAICVGAHTPRKVSDLTSASTACGTCRPDVESILIFRLGKK